MNNEQLVAKNYIIVWTYKDGSIDHLNVDNLQEAIKNVKVLKTVNKKVKYMCLGVYTNGIIGPVGI